MGDSSSQPRPTRGSTHRSGQERVGKRAREGGNWGCRTLSTRRILVASAAELYPLIEAWIQALPAASPMHATALSALAHLVTALLVGQSLRPTALMRALLSPVPVPARQRYKRVARAWTRPWLSPAWLVPRLVPAALALVPPERDGVTHLALDSVRCGGWEVFTLGVVWHGRVLPVGWAVLPYPWPKGRFTPTVCALIRQVAAVWPAERPVHLVADRGFPSRQFLWTLRQVRWGWTVRLRATHRVMVAGQVQSVRALVAAASAEGWTAQTAQYGHGPQALPGVLVIGQGLAVLPWHQRGPASVQQRLAQHGRRQAHLAANIRASARMPRARLTRGWCCSPASRPGWRPCAAMTAAGRPRAAIAMPRAAGMASTAGVWRPPWHA